MLLQTKKAPPAYKPAASAGVAARWGSTAFLAGLALASAIVFGSFAYLQVGTIAAFHDELYHHPGALNILEGTRAISGAYSVVVLGRMLPVMTASYVGAFKSYLLAPLLLVFGISPMALKLIHALFAETVVVVLRATVAAAFDAGAAGICFTVLMLDPDFISYAPTDRGPIMVGLALQLLILALFLGWARRPASASNKALYAISFLMGLGIWDKLTFLPFCITVVAAGALFYSHEFIARLRFRDILACSALFCIGNFPFLWYLAHGGGADLAQFRAATVRSNLCYPVRVWTTALEFFKSFNGQFMGGVLDPRAPFHAEPSLLPAVYGVCLALWCAAAFAAGQDMRYRKETAFATVSFLLMFFAMSLFAGMYRPWHLYSAFPLFVLSFGLIVRQLAGFGRWRVVTCALLIMLALGQGLRAFATLRDFSRAAEQYHGTSLTSPTVYRLAESIQSDPGIKTVVSLSYGLIVPVYVLTHRRGVDYVDYEFVDLTAAPAQQDLLELMRKPGTVLLLRETVQDANASDMQWLNGPLERFRAFSAQRSLRVDWNGFLAGQDGTRFYLLKDVLR